MGILISSHNLSELESFCNRVCILSKGEIIEESSIEKIKSMDENKYILKVDDSRKCEKWLLENDKIIDEQYLEVIRDEDEIALFIRNLVMNDIRVFEVQKESMSLEEAFMKKSGGEKNDKIDEK